MKLKFYTLCMAMFLVCGEVFAIGGMRDNIKWNLDKKGVLTITGVGEMRSYKQYPWEKHKGSISCLIINEGITSIGNRSFENCTSLTSVTIPNGINSIGNFAFLGCSSLTSVTIPSSVTSIGTGAFRGCSGLTSVMIPQSVSYIAYETFYQCSSLTSVTIPNSVTSIGNEAFYQCTGLTSITIPNSVTRIENYAFFGCCGLKSVMIPNSVTSIGYKAFFGCSGLTCMAIPNSVSSIGYAFYGCDSLYIYTASYASIPNFPSDRIKMVPQSDIIYYQPFSTYAKDYVEERINPWQLKGEFEKTFDWQRRVNEQTRQQKIKELLAEAEQNYITCHIKNIKPNPVLGKYDPDNEVFAMTENRFGTTYMAVPIDEASDFKDNWENKKLSYQLQIKDDNFKLASMAFQMPNGKEYTYRNTDAINYNLAEIDYDFAPIDFSLSSNSTASQGQKNITTTKVKVGKSLVDTDIPVTNASNPNTFVIVFANEDYKNVASVPFAKNDGVIFQKYCQKTLGIPVSNIQYVENASFNDMRIKLAWLNDVCDAFEGDASLIIYYAGHGIPDEASKSAYLLPVDGDSRYVQSSFKLDDFYQKLGAMKAKSVTIFMDACFSGSKREEGMLTSARGIALKAKSGVPQGNMVVFSAAQGDETAYPNREQQHGLFTYYLLKKLQETQGDVSLKDLGDYVTKQVSQQSLLINSKKQTPCVMPSASLGTEWQNWKLK